ncbi:10333_t:CDS:2, partial [Gigaspora margarita]
VLLNLVPMLIFMTLWASFIAILYLVFDIKNVSFSSDLSTNLTSSISLVVALLLALRADTAYNQNHE